MLDGFKSDPITDCADEMALDFENPSLTRMHDDKKIITEMI